jgi:deoxyadenosine/deoxycytidine kinase
MKELIYKYITIEGCIGAGKTSLARRLAADYDARLILEQFEENSFLPKFYADPERYAFPLELSFLAERFQQLKSQGLGPDLFQQYIIADYHIQKSLVFARKTLQVDEFQLFSRLYHIMILQLPLPDIMVYLYTDVERLLSNIKKRGRDYEQDIKADYLSKIQESYFDFIRQQSQMRILVIDTSHLDFVSNQVDYTLLLEVINRPYPAGVTRIQP